MLHTSFPNLLLSFTSDPISPSSLLAEDLVSFSQKTQNPVSSPIMAFHCLGNCLNFLMWFKSPECFDLWFSLQLSPQSHPSNALAIPNLFQGLGSTHLLATCPPLPRIFFNYQVLLMFTRFFFIIIPTKLKLISNHNHVFSILNSLH